MKPKIAVFIPDFFWSSIPYDGLVLYYHLLSQKFNVDLLMFEQDIRLNKQWTGQEKFYFEPKCFHHAPTLVKMKSWKDFSDLSNNYKLIITNVHMAPKSRCPEDFGVYFDKNVYCPVMMIDVGGSDILTLSRSRGTYFCVKGQIWKNWITQFKTLPENVFVTGIPHYDLYQSKPELPKEANLIRYNRFCAKYSLEDDFKSILIAPCNPASHQEQFDLNLQYLLPLQDLAKEKGYKLLIKTYPHDYIFNEEQKQYTGIYKRSYSRHRPQYEVLQEELPEAIIIDSQDHFAAMLFSDKLFNISGSHLAWETFYCKLQSYSINYKDKPYYSQAAYLPNWIHLPDEYVNINIENIEEMFDSNLTTQKDLCNNYFSSGNSIPKITEAIKTVLK